GPTAAGQHPGDERGHRWVRTRLTLPRDARTLVHRADRRATARRCSALLAAAQLTVTACLIGLAGGQLIAGPLSDRFGRRRPLLVGIIAYIAASVLCALSPSITTLVLARLAQGLAGSTGIVIAQASGRDVYEGSTLI